VNATDGLSWDRRDALLALAFLALAHAVFWPALRPHHFLFGADTIGHDYGMLLFYWSQALEHGRLALWNPYLFCGIPTLGTFAFCPFYPTTWLFAVLPFALAFSYQYILNAWLAGFWTYWAARWMGLGRVAAALAGVLFLVSGHFITLVHAGHLQKFAAIAWMPFVFGSATAAMRTRAWGWWVVAGAGIGLQLLASHVQIAYYTIGVLALWVLSGAGCQPAQSGTGRQHARGGRKDKERQRGQVSNLPHFWGRQANSLSHLGHVSNLPHFFLALVVAFGVAAAQIFPAVEMTPSTNRGGGIRLEEAATTSYPPLEYLEFVLPSFKGDNAGGPVRYWGQWGERIVTDYMGLLPILLAAFGLAAARRHDRWFWLGVLLVAALLSVGMWAPAYGLAWRFVPGFNHFRSPGTIMIFVTWPAILLAAMGLEAFLGQTKKRGWVLAIALAAAAGLAIVAAVALPLVFDRPASPRASILLSLRRSLAAGAGALLALSFVAVTRERSAPVRWLALGALFAVALLDPRLHASRYIKAWDARPFHLYLVSHWADPLLHKLPQPVRGIEVGNEYSNRMMTRGIGSLHGYHPVHLQTYVDLMNLYAHNRPALGRLVYQQFILAPAANDLGPEYARAAQENGQALWLRRPPPAYAYFPREVAALAGTTGVLRAMAAPDFDPYARSYTTDPSLAFVAAAEGSSAGVRLLGYAPGRIDLAVDSATTRPLILAELAAPGWRWELNSAARHSIRTSNHALLTVKVPAGASRITLAYAPFAFRVGLYVTLISLLLLACFAALSLKRHVQPH